MDRLNAMSILLDVIDAGSMSAAGRRRGVPLATVSRKVSDLEAHLGTRLLDRSSRRISLTDAGAAFVGACRRILEEVAEAERAAAGEYRPPKGALHLSAPVLFGRLHVLPIVTEFLGAYREIDIRLTLLDRVVDLQDDHVDVAVRIGSLPDSSLIATRVGSIRRVVCGSPAYFAANGRPTRPSDLATRDCISFTGLTSPGTWNFQVGKTDQAVAIHPRLVVNTAEAAVDAAVAGVGITRVLSYQAAAAIRAGTLAVALSEFEPDSSPVSLVYAGHRLLPQKLRAFLDFAAPRLKAGLA